MFGGDSFSAPPLFSFLSLLFPFFVVKLWDSSTFSQGEDSFFLGLSLFLSTGKGEEMGDSRFGEGAARL